MSVTYMTRIKVMAFFVVCFVLWQALRHFPSFSDFSSQSLDHRWNSGAPSVSSLVSPVVVTVFYEALCPDSRSFFTKQLLPTFEKIPHLIQINLVPYGKAKTELTGTGYAFSCQHGPLECQANKIHACAISKLTQADVQLRYTTCMISDNMNPEEIGEQLAHKSTCCSVRRSTVCSGRRSECAGGREGDELLKHHGDLTNALQPTISFVPTILLDQSDDNQPGILKNLFKEVCGVLQHK
ncbi:hypothetical protein ANN_20299, partial [Periplaneta americana]